MFLHWIYGQMKLRVKMKTRGMNSTRLELHEWSVQLKIIGTKTMRKKSI